MKSEGQKVKGPWPEKNVYILKYSSCTYVFQILIISVKLNTYK